MVEMSLKYLKSKLPCWIGSASVVNIWILINATVGTVYTTLVPQLYPMGVVHTHPILNTCPLKPSVSSTNTSVIVISCSVDVIAVILERLSDDAEPK